MSLNSLEINKPIKNNTFIVSFPNKYKIPSWLVQNVSELKFVNGKWNDIEIDFIVPVGLKLSSALFKLINKTDNFEFTIIFCSELGKELEKFKIKSNLLSVNFGALSYSNENIKMFKICLGDIQVSV